MRYQTFQSMADLLAAVDAWQNAVWRRHGKPEDFKLSPVAGALTPELHYAMVIEACGEEFRAAVPVLAVLESASPSIPTPDRIN